MSKLTVLHFPDPRLRNKALPVDAVGEDIGQLSRDMLETMYAEKGIGLAATQVGVPKRVVVMDLSEGKDSPMVLVNPEIKEKSGIEEMEEGCLSVPGFFETVRRAEQVVFQYLNLEGEEMEVRADGLLAVCVQHEIDHLDGKLFIDYLSPLKQQRLRKKLEKRQKAPALL